MSVVRVSSDVFARMLSLAALPTVCYSRFLHALRTCSSIAHCDVLVVGGGPTGVSTGALGLSLFPVFSWRHVLGVELPSC